MKRGSEEHKTISFSDSPAKMLFETIIKGFLLFMVIDIDNKQKRLKLKFT